MTDDNDADDDPAGENSGVSRRGLMAGGIGAIGLGAAAAGTAGASNHLPEKGIAEIGDNIVLFEDTNGDLVLEHLPSGAQLRHDGTEWSLSQLSVGDINIGQLVSALDANGQDITGVGSLTTDRAVINNQLSAATISSQQTISSGTITKVQFDSTVANELGYDTANNQIDVPTDGKYLITAFVRWENDTGWSTGDVASIRPFVNGVQEFVPNMPKVGTNLQGVYTPPVVLRLTSGDTIDIRAFQNSGADKALDGGANTARSRFVIARLG